ncbi:hypothetical protein EVAR_62278_1 [Eumeta japonica]|uniref:Uncharacterized protein n=1 Tax=Eumeta variegata TaxID=151549 RepID=A0A4C1Z1A1_EUMVA|nr:hypothetical protein EVAR_62278_1 [Eumeta japonica]
MASRGIRVESGTRSSSEICTRIIAGSGVGAESGNVTGSRSRYEVRIITMLRHVVLQSSYFSMRDLYGNSSMLAQSAGPMLV